MKTKNYYYQIKIKSNSDRDSFGHRLYHITNERALVQCVSKMVSPSALLDSFSTPNCQDTVCDLEAVGQHTSDGGT